MPFGPIKTWLVLLCLGTLVACGAGGGNSPATESIELSVILGPLSVMSVDYSVNCVSDENSAAPDGVRVDGELEPANNRTVKIGMLDVQTATWTGFVDLPPGSCSLQLRARESDGEVICTANLQFSVVANTPAHLIVPLECGRNTVGEFNVNFCPDLLAFRCDELDPMTENASCVVSFRDEDSTCSQSCDPQTCTTSPQGLTCTPGPDRGVSTTITCINALLDCTGDGTPDPSCTINSNTPGVSLEVGDTLVADFFVACLPPASADMSGPTITCTALTSDGDLDCDRTKLFTVDCPSLDP